jgi:hypothetical protein
MNYLTDHKNRSPSVSENLDKNKKPDVGVFAFIALSNRNNLKQFIIPEDQLMPLQRNSIARKIHVFKKRILPDAFLNLPLREISGVHNADNRCQLVFCPFVTILHVGDRECLIHNEVSGTCYRDYQHKSGQKKD